MKQVNKRLFPPLWQTTLFGTFLFLLGCAGSTESEKQDNGLKGLDKRFLKLSPSATGVSFSNDIHDTGKYTPFNNYYIYNGGGIAIGDIDNDGLADLLFSSNQRGCKLYKNLGDFKFKDVTQKAGLEYSESWTTGVSMVDINADGWLDLSVCRSGFKNDSSRRNLVFINNSNGSFSEQGERVGLNDQGPSTQTYFFDIDLDGDLDAYVLNHPLNFENTFDPLFEIKPAKDSIYSNRFYLNENGRFKEANTELGVSMEKGFSLSASVGDVNYDGWPDIYVANDFVSPDYLLINQAGRGFKDSLPSVIDKTTLFSMGSDLADVNDDGYLDLFIADMKSGDHFRRKNNNFSLDKTFYDLLEKRTSRPQYSRNMFYLGGESGFKEVGYFAGVSMTDWSWSCLFEDLDNDGHKDLFVTNGTKRDFNNLDYNSLRFEVYTTKSKKRHDTVQMIKKMPTTLISNCAYRNVGNGLFEEVSGKWGLGTKLNGQGAAIADLDNDGSLDVVVNFTDAPAGIYKNNKPSTESHFLNIELVFGEKNLRGVGSRVEVWTKGRCQMKYQYPTRGFQSSMPYRLHFGLGKQTQVDSIVVIWPNNQRQVKKQVVTNKLVELVYDSFNSIKSRTKPRSKRQLYKTSELREAVHAENDFDEFQRDRIIPFGLSRSGPALIMEDFNGDGREDLVIGGSLGSPITLFLGDGRGGFEKSLEGFIPTIEKETTAMIALDVDLDGDLDIYVGNGSNENPGKSEYLRDQVFINNGKGNFSLDTSQALAPLLDTRCLVVYDFNNDGEKDVFVGGGFVPGQYGKSDGSRILLNGGGKLVDATPYFAPQLMELGSCNSARVVQLKKDGEAHLITAGHWQPIMMFSLKENGLGQGKTIQSAGEGLWNGLLVRDLNGDGYMDIVAGNRGLNTVFKASDEKPLQLFLTDFDKNGQVDPIVTHYLNGVSAPFVGKDDFCERMPSLNNQYLTYGQFAKAPILDDLKKETGGPQLAVTNLETMILIGDEGGGFSKQELPIEVQFAPVNAICITHLTEDSLPGILMFGNSDSEFYDEGPVTANHGLLLKRSHPEGYEVVPRSISGIDVKGVVNSCAGPNREGALILGRNNQSAVLLSPGDDQ